VSYVSGNTDSKTICIKTNRKVKNAITLTICEKQQLNCCFDKGAEVSEEIYTACIAFAKRSLKFNINLKRSLLLT